MTLLFVRHGLTNATTQGMNGIAAQDDPLNKEGILQAENAANICAELHPVAVYSSSFMRAFETGQIIAKKCGAEFISTDKLKEVDVGEWGKLELNQVKQNLIDAGMWNYNDQKYTFRPPNGESWEDIVDRTGAIVQEAISNYVKEPTVVFVSHNAALKALVGNLQGKEFKEWISLKFDTGSVSAFKLEDGNYKELFVNKS